MLNRKFFLPASGDAAIGSGGLVLLGGLSSLSITVLFESINVSEGSHSTSSGSVSSDSFGRPSISSLGGSSSSRGGLSLL